MPSGPLLRVITILGIAPFHRPVAGAPGPGRPPAVAFVFPLRHPPPRIHFSDFQSPVQGEGQRRTERLSRAGKA